MNKGFIYKLREKCKAIVEYELDLSNWGLFKNAKENGKNAKIALFDLVITIIIIINSVLVGVQTFTSNPVVDFIQEVITFIFILEIFIRFLGSPTIKDYFSNGWNWFDIGIITITHLPDAFTLGGSSISGVRALRLLRTLRTLRVLRLFKAFKELTVMVKVLMKSFSSVIHAGLLLIIFSYIYAILGVILFKGGMQIEGIDPFGDLGEAFFSLFRIATGDSWTAFRYDLTHSEKEISAFAINIYFVSWHVISAFLLLNIVFGAVIANYEQLYNKEREKRIGEIVKEQLEQVERKEAEEFESIVLKKLAEIEARLK